MRKLSLVMIALILFFLSACKNDTTTLPASNGVTNYELITNGIAPDSSNAASVLVIPPPNLPPQLKLTKDQMKKIDPLAVAYKKCTDDAILRLRASEKAIQDTANAHKKIIMDAIRAVQQDKKMSAAEKKKKIDEYNKQLADIDRMTQQALINNPVRKATQAAICDCYRTYLNAVRALLTDDQKVIFDKWLSTLKGPCVNKTSSGT